MNHPPSYINLTFTLTNIILAFDSFDSRPFYDIHVFQLMFDSIDSVCCNPKYYTMVDLIVGTGYYGMSITLKVSGSHVLEHFCSTSLVMSPRVPSAIAICGKRAF